MIKHQGIRASGHDHDHDHHHQRQQLTASVGTSRVPLKVLADTTE
jgi:hypothetical protein